MKFYIHYLKTYACVNTKGRELQEFVMKFQDCLVSDEKSLANIKKEIEDKMKELEKKYPRTKPFQFKTFESQWWVTPENKYNDNHVFTLEFSAVHSTYTYPNAAGLPRQMFFLTSEELQKLKGDIHE